MDAFEADLAIHKRELHESRQHELLAALALLVNRLETYLDSAPSVDDSPYRDRLRVQLRNQIRDLKPQLEDYDPGKG